MFRRILFVPILAAQATAVSFTARAPAFTATNLPPIRLPVALQFAMILVLSRKRRNDVLNDVWDWYPGLVEDHPRFGRVFADFVCLTKIMSAFCGQILDIIYRVAEIIGKFRGGK
jgi:hypothetical protein